MGKFSKVERVKAAIDFKIADRIPISLWPHHSDVDQDYMKLSDAQFNFYRMMDLDFVKLMPYGLYAVEDYGVKIKKYNKVNVVAEVVGDFIKTTDDWDKITDLDVTKGTYGKQLLYADRMIKLMKEADDVAPIIHTIFSPLTTIYKLVGDRLFIDMQLHPAKVHQALQVITKVTKKFINENINIGVSGFFFASQLANYRFMDDKTYDEFGEKYDLQVMDCYKNETWFNVVHIHSFTPEKEKEMFQRLLNYPGNCINWHDRWAGPSLLEARELTDKCLIGGINEEQYFNKTNYKNVYGHIQEAVGMGGTKGFMLGPGCTIYEDTPIENYMAARIAIEKYGRI